MNSFIITGTLIDILPPRSDKAPATMVIRQSGKEGKESYGVIEAYGTLPAIDSEVIVSGVVSGREWQGKWFPSLKATDIGLARQREGQATNRRPEPMPLDYDVPTQTPHQQAKANGYHPGSVDDQDVPRPNNAYVPGNTEQIPF
jgi:hypothetical protein